MRIIKDELQISLVFALNIHEHTAFYDYDRELLRQQVFLC
jgi:hypothetical protein